jgi:hypothetical protein
MDSFISCNGREPMGAIGTNGLARGRLDADSLKSLQWARANGCDWDEETCAMAAAKMDTSISCSGREPMGVLTMFSNVLV